MNNLAKIMVVQGKLLNSTLLQNKRLIRQDHSFLTILTLVLLNKLRCHAHFNFSANENTCSKLLIQIQILNDKQCRSRSVGFFRSQLIWIYTVCKGRVYPGSAGQGLTLKVNEEATGMNCFVVFFSDKITMRGKIKKWQMTNRCPFSSSFIQCIPANVKFS